MKRSIFIAICIIPFGLLFAFDDKPSIPDDFKTVLEDVLDGDIKIQPIKETRTEFHQVARAFFEGVTVNEYIELSVDHSKYADMFNEVNRARTVRKNEANTQFNYEMNLLIQVGFVGQPLQIQGQQIVRSLQNKAKVIQHSITNYKNKIHFLRQNTYLYPFDNGDVQGVLVKEDLHAKAKNDNLQSALIKSYLKRFFSRYVETFRKELEED